MTSLKVSPFVLFFSSLRIPFALYKSILVNDIWFEYIWALNSFVGACVHEVNSNIEKK